MSVTTAPDSEAVESGLTQQAQPSLADFPWRVLSLLNGSHIAMP